MADIRSTVYEDALAVTPSDAVKDPAGPFAALLVTAAGTLKFTTLGGSTVTLASSVVVNSIIPVVTSRVWSTGTTATVVGLIAQPYRTRPST